MNDWRIRGYVEVSASFINIIRDSLNNTSIEVISKASIHKGITRPILRALQISKLQEMDHSFDYSKGSKIGNLLAASRLRNTSYHLGYSGPEVYYQRHNQTRIIIIRTKHNSGKAFVYLIGYNNVM